MNNDKNKGILLESGTNEMEMVEFKIGQEHFGINVIKVREIVVWSPPVFLPKAHPSVEGMVNLRGQILSVIDLANKLGYPPSEQPDQDRLIVTEFNRLKVAFHVHNVERIHRISWEKIDQPAGILQNDESAIVGMVKMDDRIILLLDFEKIVSDIYPQSAIGVDSHKITGNKERGDKKILIADDSPTLRSFLKKILVEAGYTNLYFFNNGLEALNYLEQLAKDKGEELTDQLQLVITDIEMPQMDGHYLTRRIKENAVLAKLPVVIFSSLITDELMHKGEAVGADAQVSKPQYPILIETIDNLIL